MEELLKQGILLCGNCRYYKGRRYELTDAERNVFIVKRLLSRRYNPPDIELVRMRILNSMRRNYSGGQIGHAIANLEIIQRRKHLCEEFKERVNALDIAYGACSIWQPFNGQKTHPNPILEKYF